MTEQDFIEYVYADWLEEQGDPRAEAWRVLLEMGKSPYNCKSIVGVIGGWYRVWYNLVPLSSRGLFIKNGLPRIGKSPSGDVWASGTFHSAMNAAAVAWVRVNRDAEFCLEESK